MKPTYIQSLNHSFEINLCNTLMPTSAIAVSQSINTLTHGDVLKVSSCNKNSVEALIRFCNDRGNTLLDKKYNNDEVTLFFKRN